MRYVYITLKALISVLALASMTACVPTQRTAPTMLDYSYVPPTKAIGSTQNYGIDDF